MAKPKNDRLLRQQSSPEQLSYERDNSYDDDVTSDWQQDGYENGNQHRADYKHPDRNRHLYNQQSRDVDYSNYANHSRTSYPYQQSESDSLSHRLSNNEETRRRSHDLLSYPESRRSTDLAEWDREPERQPISRTHHNNVNSTIPHSSSGNSIELAGNNSSNTAISPSAAYKTVEAPPTITLKAPTTYSVHRGQIGANYGSDHHKTQNSLTNQRFSNQEFGYLGPGPPYNVGHSSTSNGNNYNSSNSSSNGTGASSQRQSQSRALESRPYHSNSQPVMEYKTVEAPPTITLPPGSSNTMGPTPAASSAQPDPTMGFSQLPGPLSTASKQYKPPPPVPAKPVVAPKPAAPVRPQPAPRRSLQGRSSQGSAPVSATSHASSLAHPSGAFSTPPAHMSQPQAHVSNRDFGQKPQVQSSTQHGSGAALTSSYSPPQQNVFATTSLPEPAAPSASNSSFDRNNFRPLYSHGADASYVQDGMRDGISSLYNQSGNENRYSDGSQGSVRSPTSQSNFKWKLPANVAPSFV